MSALKPCENACTSTESRCLADRIVTSSMSYSCHVIVEAERKDFQVTDPNAELPSPEAHEFTECTIRCGR